MAGQAVPEGASTKRRRGNNEGSITQRKDGRWEARVSLSDGSRRVLYGKTRKAVHEKLRAALRDVDDGLPLVPQRETLGQLLAQWLEGEVKRTRRPRTYESYCSLVRVHIDPALGRRKLAQLKPQEVQAFLNQKQDSGLSASTVKYLHAILHRALGQAVRWGSIPRNVAALVTPPRIVREEVKTWTPEEAEQARQQLMAKRYGITPVLKLSDTPPHRLTAGAVRRRKRKPSAGTPGCRKAV